MLKYAQMNVSDVKHLFELGLNDRILTSELQNCNIDILKQKIDRWKTDGYTIVFTAGVFDIFTINHLLALHHYKLLGGDKVKLILSIDSDERVKQSKSFNRNKGGSVKPILSWHNRALMVAKQSLNNKEALVDLIVQHGDDTCAGIRCPHDDNVSITEIIKPDIVVVTRTSEDTIKKIHNSPIINNTSLMVIDEDQLTYQDHLLGQNISTTAIIQRIRHEI